MNQDMGLGISECPCGYLWVTLFRLHAGPESWKNPPRSLAYLSWVTQQLGHCSPRAAISNSLELGCGPQGTPLSFLLVELIIKEEFGTICLFLFHGLGSLCGKLALYQQEPSAKGTAPLGVKRLAINPQGTGPWHGFSASFPALCSEPT